MTGQAEKPESGIRIVLNTLEVVVLLLLPLPFFKLNILYLIFALIIILTSKYLRKEKWAEYGFKTINFKILIVAVFLEYFMVLPTISCWSKPSQSYAVPNLIYHHTKV